MQAHLRRLTWLLLALPAISPALVVPLRAQPTAPGAGDPTARGPHPVATAQISYTYQDDTDPLDLYYPAAGPPAPVVVLLPSGSTGGPENHVGHGEHLASWGYVVAVVHGVPFADGTDVAANAARASAALDAVLASGLLSGRVTDRAGIVGTHFNGSSATRAAVRDSRFRAVVGLHPALFPGGSSGAADLTVPTLVLGGNVEGGLLCTYGRSWQELYFAAGSAHKAVFLFPDARPSDFQEPPWDNPFNFCGKPRDRPFPWIRGLMTAWLEYYLRGDVSAYGDIYGAGGEATLPPETSDSIADNYPRGLKVVPVGSDGAELTWRASFTDTTVLAGIQVLRARGSDPFETLDQLPLEASRYLDRGLEPGVTYKFTVAYRDKGGHVFQTAEPVALQGGAPTPTPTKTPRPTRTPTPTATEPPPPTPTATPPVLTPQVYLPRVGREG